MFKFFDTLVPYNMQKYNSKNYINQKINRVWDNFAKID